MTLRLTTGRLTFESLSVDERLTEFRHFDDGSRRGNLAARVNRLGGAPGCVLAGEKEELELDSIRIAY